MRYLFLLALPFLLIACADDDGQVLVDPLGDEDYFLFGVYGAYCAGDCTYLYRYVNDTIQRAEPVDWRPGDAAVFEHAEYGDGSQTQESYEAEVLQLLTDFPATLRDNPEQHYCCSNIADGYKVYLELKAGDERRFWTLDLSEGDPLDDYAGEVKRVAFSLR